MGSDSGTESDTDSEMSSEDEATNDELKLNNKKLAIKKKVPNWTTDKERFKKHIEVTDIMQTDYGKDIDTIFNGLANTLSAKNLKKVFPKSKRIFVNRKSTVWTPEKDQTCI